MGCQLETGFVRGQSELLPFRGCSDLEVYRGYQVQQMDKPEHASHALALDNVVDKLRRRHQCGAGGVRFVQTQTVQDLQGHS